MTREIIGTLLILIVPLVALLAFRSVRNTRKQQESEMSEPFQLVSNDEQGHSGFYVSTVYSASPLTKIWAYGLGSRGSCEISVNSEGVSIKRKGERDFLISSSQLLGLDRASATIDKGVERGGLMALRWKLGSTELLTNIRVSNTEQGKDLEKEITSRLGVSF